MFTYVAYSKPFGANFYCFYCFAYILTAPMKWLFGLLFVLILEVHPLVSIDKVQKLTSNVTNSSAMQLQVLPLATISTTIMADNSHNFTELSSTVTAANYSTTNSTTELLTNWFAFKIRFALQCVLVFIVLLCVMILCFMPGMYAFNPFLICISC